MDWTRTIYVGAGSMLLGIGLGYYFVPTQMISKVTHVDVINVRKNVTTTTTKKPDGSTTTVVVDKSTTNTDHSKIKYKEIKKDNLNYLISGLYTRNLDGRSEIIISIQRRVFGELYLGVSASNQGYFGVGASYRF